MLSDVIKNNIDMRMISEAKLDSSFPKGHFQIPGYFEPYRFDRNGIHVFFKKHVFQGTLNVS